MWVLLQRLVADLRSAVIARPPLVSHTDIEADLERANAVRSVIQISLLLMRKATPPTSLPRDKRLAAVASCTLYGSAEVCADSLKLCSVP